MLTHHAYYIEGSPGLFGAYREALKPFWAKKFDRFGVEDARALIALAALKRERQAFLIALSSVTTEAQQALLKLLEEPQEGTTFVFLLPHGVLLPTVRSRMMAYPMREPASADEQARAKFLKSSHAERSDFIATMLKDEDSAKENARAFIDALEAELYKKIKDPAARQGLEDIAMARDYLRDRSPSLKMLLEHLALCLPHN